jgi:hypothetical protein
MVVVNRSLASDESLEIGIEGGEAQMEAGTQESYLTKLRLDLVRMRLQWNPGEPPCFLLLLNPEQRQQADGYGTRSCLHMLQTQYYVCLRLRDAGK